MVDHPQYPDFYPNGLMYNSSQMTFLSPQTSNWDHLPKKRDLESVQELDRLASQMRPTSVPDGCHLISAHVLGSLLWKFSESGFNFHEPQESSFSFIPISCVLFFGPAVVKVCSSLETHVSQLYGWAQKWVLENPWLVTQACSRIPSHHQTSETWTSLATGILKRWDPVCP